MISAPIRDARRMRAGGRGRARPHAAWAAVGLAMSLLGFAALAFAAFLVWGPHPQGPKMLAIGMPGGLILGCGGLSLAFGGLALVFGTLRRGNR